MRDQITVETSIRAQLLTDILALDEAIRDGTAKTFASLLLVTVITGTVEETVASFDGIVNGLSRKMIEDTPNCLGTRMLTSAQVALVT